MKKFFTLTLALMATISLSAKTNIVWDFTNDDFIVGTWKTSSGQTNKAVATDGSTQLSYVASGSGDKFNANQLQTNGKSSFSGNDLSQAYFALPNTLSGAALLKIAYGTTANPVKLSDTKTTKSTAGLDTIQGPSASTTYYFDTLTYTKGTTYYLVQLNGKSYYTQIAWIPLDSITFDATTNGGTCSTTLKRVANGNAIGTLPTPSKDNALFDGWYTTASGEGDKIEATTVINDNATYYARFTESSCAATIPGNISKGALSKGNLTLTAAGSPAEGDTWYWQSTEEGEDQTGTSGASKVVSAAGTYYIRSYNTAGNCWSFARSITISAEDLITKFTVVYMDGLDTLGTEKVAENGSPANFTTYQTLYGSFGTFGDWYNNADLAEGHKIADISALTITEDVTVYGKWDKSYATTADFAAITKAGTTASNPIDDFLADHNMLAEGLTSESKWETSTAKTGFIGYKLKDSGAVVKFLAQSGKYVTITLGNIGDNVTLSKGGTTSTIAKKTGDSAETTVDSFSPKADMVVSLTTSSAATVTLKKIAITNSIPTALDNTTDEVKAVKRLENGMLVIEKNGVRYNAQGQVVR